MGALRDLFMSAMEPIMTEANMNLFINSVDAAANVVNRFAQFVNQMRDDVLSFLSTIDGDMDDFFEAMHDTFVLLQPVLRGFIEFFISDVPRIIKRFAVLTENISGDVGLIISSIGALIDELLDFASVIIGVLAPVIFVLTAAIETLFSIFNFFPNIVKTTVVALAVMGFIVSALTLKFISMAASLSTLHTQMVAQIGTSSVLAATYNALSANLARYLSGQISLRMALAATNLTLMKGISAWAASTAAKLLNLSTTNALIVAMGRQLAAISALTAGNIGLATAAKLTAANIKFFTLSMWASAKAAIVAAAGSIHAAFGFGLVAIKSTLAAGGVWLLNSALTYLASPIWLTVAAIAALIAGIVAIAQAVTQNDIFAPLIDGANNVINKLKEMLGFMDVIPGIGGGGDILGPENARDIQTNPNVDLSFEDSVENNVEVQADPEDKAQLSRITKDALEEANSFDRRQQGGQ